MLNTIHIIGRLGGDAEVKTTQSGSQYARISVATERNKKSRDGQWEKVTTWVPLTTWSDKIFSYLTKGRLIYVRGRVDTYKDKEGNSRLGLTAEDIKFLSRGDEQQKTTTEVSRDGQDDDIPF